MKKICGQGQPTPCYKNGKHCPNRSVGCHATCEAYMKAWNYNVNVVYPRREEQALMYDYTKKEIMKSMARSGLKR